MINNKRVCAAESLTSSLFLDFLLEEDEDDDDDDEEAKMLRG